MLKKEMLKIFSKSMVKSVKSRLKRKVLTVMDLSNSKIPVMLRMLSRKMVIH